MKPFGLFCRRRVFSAAGESHSLPKILAIPSSEPHPPAGPSYSTVSEASSPALFDCTMILFLFGNQSGCVSPTHVGNGGSWTEFLQRRGRTGRGGEKRNRTRDFI